MLALPLKMVHHVQRSPVPVTVTAADGDMPLVMVNAAFCRMTGFASSDILGRNPRFLQGPETDPEDRDHIRAFLSDPGARQRRVVIRNYRRDGAPFDDLIFFHRLRHGNGSTAFFFAAQFDLGALGAELGQRGGFGRINAQLAEADSVAQVTSSTSARTAETLTRSIATMGTAELLGLH